MAGRQDIGINGRFNPNKSPTVVLLNATDCSRAKQSIRPNYHLTTSMATATPPQPVKVVLRSHEPPAVSLQDLATHDLQIDLGWDTFQHTVDTFVKEVGRAF